MRAPVLTLRCVMHAITVLERRAFGDLLQLRAAASGDEVGGDRGRRDAEHADRGPQHAGQ
jgi:hypothetical protein